jgi:hypothetical protein
VADLNRDKEQDKRKRKKRRGEEKKCEREKDKADGSKLKPNYFHASMSLSVLLASLLYMHGRCS